MSEEVLVEKKGSKTLLFAIIGVVVFLIAVIVVVLMFTMGGSPKEEAMAKEQNQSAPKKTQNVTRQSDFVKIGPLMPIDPIVVNLMSQNSRRYLKVGINLEMSSPNMQNELTTKNTIIKDSIIELLSSKSIEEVATTKGKDRVKDEIIQRLNEFLLDGYVKNIFFTEFVIQ